MALSKKLKEELRDLIASRVLTKLKAHNFEKSSGNPFVDVMFGKYANIKYFIHGTATMMGSEYELIAVKIAKSNHAFVEAKKSEIKGKISRAERAYIGERLRKMEAKVETSDYNKEIEDIYKLSSSNLTDIRIVIDLYLKDRNGKEYFVEMKGPDPNKKEVRAAKEDLLNIVAIKKRDMTLAEFKKKIAVIFGIYYNNEKGAYKNWKVSPMFETGKGLFVQEEFWDFLGGKGAYKDLLEVIADVKELVVKEIENRFTNL